ncbi:MAG TPA: ABC transporter permease [Chloroflexia bacterium]|jgi:ABC-type dipeptide/oligopeptide/nickel transport system permease subunit
MAVIRASDQNIPRDMALAGKTRSLWGDAWRRLRRNKLAVGGVVVLVLMSMIAVFADVIAPYDYDQTVRDPVTKLTIRNQPSSPNHLFGTDDLSRDEFSRVVYGTRISLSVGLVSQLIILAVGIPIGLIAGYFGRGIDMVLMRITDIMYAFPTILFAVVILAAIGQNLINIYLAIGLTFWPGMARLVRSQVLSIREKEYIEAARAIGVSSWRIMFVQILPNALGPIIVAATFGIPFAILVEAFLSFIGIGVPAPIPSWGAMIARGKDQIRSEYWLVLFPSAALAVTLFAFNFFGDGLRDALDPRSRK